MADIAALSEVVDEERDNTEAWMPTNKEDMTFRHESAYGWYLLSYEMEKLWEKLVGEQEAWQLEEPDEDDDDGDDVMVGVEAGMGTRLRRWWSRLRKRDESWRDMYGGCEFQMT